eukprot:TRINITY_DN466_c0_g2_i1.p1 TRINITY_DN466_c0_g2~~TRINITY_DN466_c0_g2_i1.p1  ORF type:complete len:122 (-),score=8.71 TRINITY_DN466_c0_g2_i1:382-747(-)
MSKQPHTFTGKPIHDPGCHSPMRPASSVLDKALRRQFSGALVLRSSVRLWWPSTAGVSAPPPPPLPRQRRMASCKTKKCGGILEWAPTLSLHIAPLQTSHVASRREEGPFSLCSFQLVESL